MDKGNNQNNAIFINISVNVKNVMFYNFKHTIFISHELLRTITNYFIYQILKNLFPMGFYQTLDIANIQKWLILFCPLP